MANSRTADFLIVGAGAAGLSLARELSEFARVIVLEREDAPGYHATGRSAAIFVGTYGDAVVQGLSAASRLLLESPPFPVDQALLSRPRGILYVARPGCPTLKITDRRRELPRLSAAAARARVPILREAGIDHALWEAEAADIDVHSMLTALQRRIRARNGEVILSSPVTNARRAGGLWTVTAGTLTVQAPIVVNAAGAWATEIGTLFGAGSLPLTPCRRTAATISPPAGADIAWWPMVVDLEESVYFKPEAGTVLLSPADEVPVAAHDAFADPVDVATAVDRFEALTDHSVQRVLSSWAGLRTLTRDRRPVIGYDAEVKGLFWLAGQGGFGIQTALGAAALARALIAETRPRYGVPLIPLLSPHRFSQQEFASS